MTLEITLNENVFARKQCDRTERIKVAQSSVKSPKTLQKYDPNQIGHIMEQ